MSDKFQFIQYNNLRKAFLDPKYRNMESLDQELKYEDFSKTMLAQKYIVIKCRFPQNFRRVEYRGQPTLVVLTRHDSEFHNRSKELITLLDKLSTYPEVKESNLTHLFLITVQELKKRTLKKIKEYKNFAFTNILAVRFSIELPEAVHCRRHEIVSAEEVKTLEKECNIGADYSSKNIQEGDAQNLWIGGFPGELIMIKKESMMAGYSIDYRYITGQITRTESADDEAEEDDGDAAEDDGKDDN